MTTKIQLRRATASAWTAANPVLALGEAGVETDTYKLKVGDGVTVWSSLPYFVHGWADITGKPAVIAAGATQAAARSAISAASLDQNGKVPVSELPASLMQYLGVWDASTNSPSLVDGTGDAGDVYRVTVAGNRNLGSGSISFAVGDYVIYNGAAWEKSDTTDAVSTVAGRVGDVTLTVSDVSGAVSLTGTQTLSGKTLSAPVFSGAITPDTSTASSAGFLGTPVVSVSAAYTFALSDSGDVVLHPSSDTTARTWTIPANASVAFPVGSVLSVVNLGGAITLAITSDTLTQIGTGSTGSRTLAQNGLATLIKVAATQWVISGNGLT